MATKLDIALEECLDHLRTGDATVEECLQRYPDLQDQLRPLLATASQVQELSEFKPRAEFRSQTRAMLRGYMRASPRQRPTFGAGFLRLATSAAVVFAALITTSAAFAQQAVPGDTLYPVKLTSERVWRSFQADPVQADAFLANRRVEELQAIQGQADLEQIGVSLYVETITQLRDAVEDDPQLAIWLTQLVLVQKDSLEELFVNSTADLPDPDKLFYQILTPLNGVLPVDLLPEPAVTPAPPGEGAAPAEGISGRPTATARVIVSTATPAQSRSVIPTILPVIDGPQGDPPLVEPLIEALIEPIKGLLDSLLGK